MDKQQSNKTKEELGYSRPLDVHKWSDHPEVNIFINDIWHTYFEEKFSKSGKGKQPKSSPKIQLKVLLLDLYVARYEDPALLLGVGLSNSFYKANSRYNEIHISALMIDIVRAAYDKGLIGLHLGSESAKKTTRIWPTETLAKAFDEAKFGVLSISSYERREAIVLNKEVMDVSNAKKAKPIEYRDSDYSMILPMREDLNKYNELLSRTFIDIPTLDLPVIKTAYLDKGVRKSRKVQIAQYNKFVRRIFYRGSWKLGGRFHGGWWQQISEEWRKQIYIEGKGTIEVDFSGLHVNLLYGLRREQPVSDPYSVDLDIVSDKEELRGYVKSLALMAINASSEAKAFQAFRNEQPNRSKAKCFTNKQLGIMLDAFKEKNHKIKDDLCTDMGVSLMALDGRITSRIINHFTAKNIPILTIHDSYIIEFTKDNEIKKVLDEATQAELDGFKVNITQGALGLSEAGRRQLGSDPFKDRVDELPNYVQCEGYQYRKKQFNNYFFSSTE